jgi:NADH-quinone oxidoreductase subunit J
VELLVFGFLALLALIGAVGVIFKKNPIHCAVYLLLTLFAVAAMFAVMWAEFIAVVQLLVYAGGIMVLFLFVIMLVDLDRRGLDDEMGRIGTKPSRLHRTIWALIAVALAVALGYIISRAGVRPYPTHNALKEALQGPMSPDRTVLGNVEWVGQLLYTSYLLPFELASVLLLVAMIGATVVARRQGD